MITFVVFVKYNISHGAVVYIHLHEETVLIFTSFDSQPTPVCYRSFVSPFVSPCVSFSVSSLVSSSLF